MLHCRNSGKLTLRLSPMFDGKSMNKGETLTGVIGTMHSGGAELEEQDLKPIKQGSLHLTPFGGGFTEKICSKVLSRVAKLVMHQGGHARSKAKRHLGRSASGRCTACMPARTTKGTALFALATTLSGQCGVRATRKSRAACNTFACLMWQASQSKDTVDFAQLALDDPARHRGR